MTNNFFPALGVFFTQRVIGGNIVMPWEVDHLSLHTELLISSNEGDTVVVIDAESPSELSRRIFQCVEQHITPGATVYSPHFNAVLGPLLKWGAWSLGARSRITQAVDVVEAFWYPRYLTMEARCNFNFSQVIRKLGWDTGFLKLCEEVEPLNNPQWQHTQLQLSAALTRLLHTVGHRDFPRA